MNIKSLQKKGDIIIASRYLAHYICAPNNSENIRKIIWFRIVVDDEIGFGNCWYKFDIMNQRIGGGLNKIDIIDKYAYRLTDSLDNTVKTRIKVGKLPNYFSATAQLKSVETVKSVESSETQDSFISNGLLLVT